MFDRLEKLIGKESLDKIKSKKILLVGLGGVGGISLEMLIRSGISNITIIDYDIFEESNLNRQLLCNVNDIGKKKTDVAKNKMLEINKLCNINIINEKLDDNLIKTLDNDYDYIIDAIDDIEAKISLIKFATKNNIKIISACATGKKIDPTKLTITNIWKTTNDPLAKKLRYELRKQNINYKLMVVSSTEKVIKTNDNIIPSMAMVPNVAGILLASYVINDIIQK